MKLKPMADNVLLKQNEAQETTVSGIILATTNKEKPAIYEVVSVGPGTKDVTMTVKTGDRVVVGKYTGSEIKLDGVDYTDKLTEIISQNDIRSLTIVRMEVPCCGGLELAAKTALQRSGKWIPWQVVTVSIDGQILDAAR